jgi:hypothetical protein
VQFRATGAQPTDQKNWDFVVDGSGNMATRSLNDAYSASNNYLLFVRGSGYSLTDARASFAVPVAVPGYTIATLPTCSPGGRQGMNAYVSNGQATPPYLGVVSTTGAVVAPVFCNGTAWIYH